MLWLVFILASLVGAFWLYAGEAVHCLLARAPAHERSGNLPSRYGEATARHRAEAHAWHVVIRGGFALLLALAYVFSYMHAHDKLVAKRDAARMQPPPYNCMGDHGHAEMGFLERTALQFTSAQTIEAACAEWLEHGRLAVWPNPAAVLADLLFGVLMGGIIDHVGHAVFLFVNNFGWFMQAYAVTMIVVLAIVFLYLAPTMSMFSAVWKPRRCYSQAEVLPPPSGRARLHQPPPRLCITDVSCQDEDEVYERFALTSPETYNP